MSNFISKKTLEWYFVFSAAFGILYFLLLFSQKYESKPVTVLSEKQAKEMNNMFSKGRLGTTTLNNDRLKENLINLAKHIHKTLTYVRGTKARKYALSSFTIITKLLRMSNISNDVIQRTSHLSPYICPEIYKGPKYGYPSFNNGFETTNCSFSVPIENLLSVVFFYNNNNIQALENILHGIEVYNNKLPVLLGTFMKINQTRPGIQNRLFSSSELEGSALNSLVKLVSTKFVLIVRNITYFNADARLHRLIREIDSLNITAAAGSSRDQNGHWQLGCFQSAYKNFSLVYSEGYDESKHECIFCDYVEGSFVVKTQVIKDVGFDKEMDGTSLYHDFFLRLSKLNYESIVCPDSMFYMYRQKRSNDENDWRQFRQKWELSRLIFHKEIDIQFKCERNYKCVHKPGFTLSPCCLQDLAEMVKFVMSICENNNIICEVVDGTLIGVVKFQKPLPWEIDADVVFLTSNLTVFSELKKSINAKYYYKTDGNNLVFGNNRWFIELWNQHTMDSVKLKILGMPTTKILFDGQWVATPRNPGLHARNRYGHEIYAHAEHWRTTGKKDSWVDYKSNYFITCKEPGDHKCLDNYNADGNIQFDIPIP